MHDPSRPITDWLLAFQVPLPPQPGAWTEEARTPPDGAELLLSELAERLVAAGLPLTECSFNLFLQHPEVFGHALTWVRGKGCTRVARTYAAVARVTDAHSPMPAIKRGGPAQRCRLEGRAGPAPWRMVEDLGKQGATDFFIVPLIISDGRRSFFYAATDARGGFRDDQIALIEAIAPALSVRVELASAYATTRELLEVYLGPNASKRVLDGTFQRGTGELVQAVVWMCDLRGFTTRVDRQPLPDVIPVLNAYFERVAAPVEEHGGEILKFIGDALLAVFPVAGAAADACRRALAAAEQSLAALDALNAEQGDAPLKMGIALHRGEVMYGNIGAHRRLDFTVIGRVVNEAARVEPLCKELGVPLIATQVFAEGLGTPLASLGAHALRGVAAPQELFTLPRYARRP